MARNYAALLYDYLEEWKELKEAEVGRLCIALMEYSRDGKPIKLSGNERFYAARVMMQEDRFKESYELIVEQRRKAGKASADKRMSTDVNESQREPTRANETNNKEIETEIETEINIPVPIGTDISRARPSVEDVRSYCQERGNNVDAEAFVAFYESNGWKVGKNPMKDWKAAVRTWETRDRPKGRPGFRAQQHNGELNALQREAVARLMKD